MTDKCAQHLTFGSILLKAGRSEQAIKHLLLAAESQEADIRCSACFELGSAFFKIKDYDRAVVYLKELLIERPSNEAAIANLASVFLASGRLEESISVCEDLLSLTNNRSRAGGMTLYSALRAAGRLDEAIDRTWKLLDLTADPIKKRLIPKSLSSNDRPLVCCVKWGCKYSGDYVNFLFRGVARNWKKEIPEFICFTDDPVGVEFPTRPLPEIEFSFFWGKAHIFDVQKDREILYLDLDTVVVGDLSKFIIKSDCLKTLRARGLNNEAKGVPSCAVNSSVMQWRGGEEWRLVSEISSQKVRERVHRFDHWIEMCARGCIEFFNHEWVKDFVQINEGVSPETSLIIFPGKIKPHMVEDSSIVKQHWY